MAEVEVDAVAPPRTAAHGAQLLSVKDVEPGLRHDGARDVITGLEEIVALLRIDGQIIADFDLVHRRHGVRRQDPHDGE